MVRFGYPLLVGLAMLLAWAALSALDAFPIGTVPSPAEVAIAFGEELASGRLLDDIIASLYRVAWGFVDGGARSRSRSGS